MTMAIRHCAALCSIERRLVRRPFALFVGYHTIVNRDIHSSMGGNGSDGKGKMIVSVAGWSDDKEKNHQLSTICINCCRTVPHFMLMSHQRTTKTMTSKISWLRKWFQCKNAKKRASFWAKNDYDMSKVPHPPVTMKSDKKWNGQ